MTFIIDATKRPSIPKYDRAMPCPKCHGETETGFGFAGGGYGIYSFCKQCGTVVSKSETPDE